MTTEARLRLLALSASNAGRLTPEAVVKEARKDTSPLHQYFEWDDRKAAYTARLETARRLITEVRLHEVDRSYTLKSVMYVRDPRLESSEQGYISIVEARDDANLSRQILQQEIRRVESMITRAREVADALQLDDEFERVLESLSRLRAKLVA